MSNTTQNKETKGAGMKKLITGYTARQELILHASTKMVLRGCSANDACAAVLDGCKPHDGTIGGEMAAYYLECSDDAHERMLKEVEKQGTI